MLRTYVSGLFFININFFRGLLTNGLILVQLVAGGVRAVWNFAPVNLRIPQQVIVTCSHRPRGGGFSRYTSVDVRNPRANPVSPTVIWFYI
jgi:hypothetical protein